MNESFHQTKAPLAYLIKKVLHTKHSESFEYTITKTTMQAMNIITLNADAIDLMQQGNFQDAIPVFRVALRELHDRFTDDQKQDMDPWKILSLSSNRLLSMKTTTLSVSTTEPC
jgi:hypothetical protein